MIIQKPYQKKSYHTIDGRPYFLRYQSQNNINISGNYLIRAPVIGVNAQPNGSEYVMFVKSDKKIIPLCAQLSYYDTFNQVNVVDISSVYYYCTNLNNYQKPLTKLLGFTDRVYYVNNMLYGYTVNYNKAIFSDDDFIDCSAGNPFYIFFTGSLASAMASGVETYLVPSGTYNVAFTFLYFELETK
jgi:hypothetical protein